MNEDDLNQIVYSKNVIEFVTVANEYCNFVERISGYTTGQTLSIAQKILPLIYLKATLLPEVEKHLDEDTEKFVTELDYNILLQKWNHKLGEYDGFQEIYISVMEFSGEAIEASISENILDIYQVLKDFISLYSLGNEDVMNDALSECIDQFKEFWGQQLVNVLRAIHKLVVGDIDFNENFQLKPGAKKKDESDWVNGFFDQFRDDNL